jgi:TonB family protein
MSYASSDKSSPNLLKRIPQKLSQPTAIAVIASLGIHAALGLSLPYLPISSQEKPKPARDVELLELKPEELNRLPPSPLALQPLPPGLNQQLKPLSPSGSSSLSGLPPLPSNVPSLGDLPLDPLPTTGGLSGKLSKRSTGNSSLRNELNAKKTNEPPLPSEIFKSQGGKSAVNPQFKIATGSRITPNRSRRELSRLVDGLTASTEIPILPDTSNSNSSSGTSSPGSFNPNQPSGIFPPPPPTSPLAVNPGFTGGTQTPNQFGTSGSTRTLVPTTQAAVPSSGQRNLTDLRDTRNFNAFVQNLDDWKKRNQVIGDLEERPIIVGKYPEKARTSGVGAGSVQVNWKVDKDGTIIPGSLEVIGSSEGGIFDEEAIAAVKKQAIPAPGQEKAYTVRVIFMDDSKVPGTSAGSSTTPSNGKNPSQQQSPAETLTAPIQLTPPERPIKPEWSNPNERKIPSLPQNLLEQSTPSEGKTPADRITPIAPSTPSEGKTPTQNPPTERVVPIAPSTPSEGKTPTQNPPTERVTPIAPSTPSEEKTPTQKPPTERVAPIERLSPGEEKKPVEKTPVERSSPNEEKKPVERVVVPIEPSSSSEGKKPAERIVPTERQNSSERSTSTESKPSSESQNSERSRKLPEPQSSEKPQRLPAPPSPAKLRK